MNISYLSEQARMWQRLLVLFRHLFRAIKLSKLVRKIVRWTIVFCKWVAVTIIGLLVLWIVGGNLFAAHQEKRVDQARSEFIKQFPYREANNSALKLEELGAGFGLGKLMGLSSTSTRYLHLPDSKANIKPLDEDLRKKLSQYLDSQLDKPNDEIDVPPEEVRQYLTNHAAELDLVRTHILRSELPKWEMDVSKVGDIRSELPSFLSLANFQKILLVDTLEKTRQGKDQLAIKNIEASWKLNQALLEQPYLISYLVFIINARPQAVVMRKIQGISNEWQERINHLNKFELPQAFLMSLYSEAFVSLSARKYSTSQFIEDGDDSKVDSFTRWIRFLTDPVTKPYIRLMAVNYFNNMNQIHLKLAEQDFCAFNPDDFQAQAGLMPDAWWNPINRFSLGGSFHGQWRRLGKTVLRFELTQKVLRIKEIAQNQGRFPNQIPGIESSICRGANWIYQLRPEGKALISFSKDLPWIQPDPANRKIGDQGDRLQYQFTIKQLKLAPTKLR